MGIRTQNYTLGRGEVKIAPFVGGTQRPGGFRYIGNTPAFGVSYATQELDHFGSDHGVGELDFSIATQVTRSGTVTTDNISLENLALSFLGTKSTNTQTATAAGAVIEPTIIGVKQGFEYQLGYGVSPAGARNITNVVVKVGAVAKVLATDYTVDLVRGIVAIIEGGGIANGASIDVTYDRVAGSYDQVISGGTPFEGALLFVADNPAGPNTDYLMPWVRLTPNGEFALKAENALQTLSFNLKVLKASGKEAMYANGQPYA